MAIPIWAGRYIGIPFKIHGRDRSGLDCWGLVRLITAEQFGIASPSFKTEYKNAGDHESIRKLIERETEKRTDVEIGTEKLGDLVVFSWRGVPFHIGLVLGDGCMLHIEKNTDSAIERYNGPRWGDKIYGIFK